MIFGVTTLLVIPTVFNLEPIQSYYNLYCVSGTLLGSLFPDIDLPKSKVGRKVKPISWIIYKLFGHRGFTHSLLALFLLVQLLKYFNIYQSFIVGFSIGYLSHLLGDMFTLVGVPLCYPYRRKFTFIFFHKKKT